VRQAGERLVDVDHMRTTSNPNSHGSVTSDLHIRRQTGSTTRTAPAGYEQKRIALVLKCAELVEQCRPLRD
jgi:hypothetical protein